MSVRLVVMMSADFNGFYLFPKAQGTDTALKEMLQFLKTNSPGRNLQFAYVEAETSLIPHLTLWENLHIVFGGSSWEESIMELKEQQHLINLIKDPSVVASAATAWERLTISLIKATLLQAQHILVDINESIHSPLNVFNFKKILTTISQQKNVYIATSNISLWLDSSHSLVKRKGYEFEIEILALDSAKRPQTA